MPGRVPAKFPVALAILFLATALEARAALIEDDLFVEADGLITIDDLTSLRWLAPSVTTRLSFDDLVQGRGNSWFAEGWRYATRDQICGLVNNYTDSSPPCPEGADINFPIGDPVRNQLLRLADFLGFTDTLSAGSLTLSAVFADSDGPVNGVGWGAIIIGEQSAQYRIIDNVHNSFTEHRTLGHWLVIPEPSTAVLFGFGLVVLYAAAPRR